MEIYERHVEGFAIKVPMEEKRRGAGARDPQTHKFTNFYKTKAKAN
jgi:hypothetical protein